METVLLWMSAALFAGYLCRLIFIPTIVGFIASGYLFSLYDGSGRSLLDIPSEIGVELLLFSIGLKIKPSSLLNPSLFFVFLMHSSAVFFIFLIIVNLGVSLDIKVLICLAFTFSSTIIASKALENRNELTTFHGRLAISILIFQDILALIVLLLTNDTSWTPSTLYLLALPLLIPLLKILLEKFNPTEELELITTILLALLLGSALFKYAGLSGEIGALTLGMLMANYKSAKQLGERIWTIREILLVAFFFSLGMSLDLNLQIIYSAILLTILIFIKSIVLFGLLLVFKLRAYTAFLIVISLATYSEFSLILISSWEKNGLLNSETFSILTCTICLSFALGAILNNLVHEIFVILEKYLVSFERRQHHPDEQPHTCGGADVMVLGMGRVGSAIFDNLSANNIKVVGFDADTNLVKEQLKFGKRVTFADAEDPGFWSKLRFGKLKAIILALPEFHAQNWSTQQARRYGFKGKIIVPTRSQGNPETLRISGADEIYDAYQATGIGVTEIFLKD